MALLIQPILDAFAAVLSGMDASTLGDLTPFAIVKSAGVNVNFPYAAVEPAKTVFDPEADQSYSQAHAIAIEIGVAGTDPESLKTDVVAYCAAVFNAVYAASAATPSPWPAQVLEVFVSSVEWSTTYSNGSMFSRYATVLCAVKAEEYP